MGDHDGFDIVLVDSRLVDLKGTPWRCRWELQASSRQARLASARWRGRRVMRRMLGSDPL